jgi:hypothetical protein
MIELPPRYFFLRNASISLIASAILEMFFAF